MRRAMARLAQTLMMAVMLTASVTVQANPDPQKAQSLVEETTQEMLSVLREAGPDDDAETIKQRLRELILPRLDFVTMTKLAVGRDWLDASDDQKRALVREFRDLLVRTYARSLTEYEDQEIEFLPVDKGEQPKRATVRSQVVQNDGTKIPLHFSMRYNDGEWTAFDITIDGVSLVKTYRSSFSSQIEEAGIDGLIARLEEKNEAGESADVSP